ncbi:hypothetical protein [Flavobacterium anhuiense]|uniref:Lipoprotein n=1 Tax=Flavobacterium anhuiense TaxID=459526 RepID=A0ABY0LQB1_9FLAO|nr:hypothetical protein [Flavobacterium anhuiense]SCY50164.1 hypothetical protein SAMN02927916_2320 [Flavobacterium anhuiense]
MSRIFLIAMLLFCALQSCNSNQKSIDKIISKYDSSDFSCLKNTYIETRSVNKDDIVLLVSKYNLHCNPYIVWVNSKTKKITRIDDNLPNRDCAGYFTNTEIKFYIDFFLKLNFMVLGVDNEDNVYINPNYYDVPYLVRKSKKTNAKDLKDYKLYKGDWYIKKGYKR